jgi:hypothetical protein
MWCRESHFGATPLANCGGGITYGCMAAAMSCHTGCSFPDDLPMIGYVDAYHWHWHFPSFVGVKERMINA